MQNGKDAFRMQQSDQTRAEKWASPVDKLSDKL